MLNKIRNLINSEIKEENEPKKTAVLVRVICLVDILFTIINVALMSKNYNFVYGIHAFAFLLMFVIVLYTSYHVKMHALVVAYFLVMTLNSIYFTLSLGVVPMYHIQLFIVILLFFYKSSETSLYRVVSVVISGIVALSLVLYVMENGSLLDLSSNGGILLVSANTVYIMAKVSLFAYFFMLKFSASETKIMQYSRKLEMIATTDPLTKLQNRRGMFKHIEDYIEDTPDNNLILTLGIGDIDFFKKINDTYGHEAGDYVLETLAKIMKEFMRDKGMVARWGGEEFLFSFEGINGDHAFEQMNKLLHLIEKYEFSYNGTDIKVTMTFGIEEYDEREGVEKTVSKADQKLYMGKEAGRDRVVF